jgi:hypothetical protein
MRRVVWALHARRGAGGDGAHRVVRGKLDEHLLHARDHLVRHLVQCLDVAGVRRVGAALARLLQALAQP